jgi:hypothetical protein
MINLELVRGAAPNNVWAVASGGWATHWNGTAWSDASSRFIGVVEALAVTPDSGAFAASGGEIIHRDL